MDQIAMSKARKSLQQMAAASSNNGAGWECPGCGCRDLRGEGNSSVESTRNPKGELVIRRKRICRHCRKYGVTTEETIVPAGYKLKVVPDDEEEVEAA